MRINRVSCSGLKRSGLSSLRQASRWRWAASTVFSGHSLCPTCFDPPHAFTQAIRASLMDSKSEGIAHAPKSKSVLGTVGNDGPGTKKETAHHQHNGGTDERLERMGP